METLISLRSQGGAQVTQGSGLKKEMSMHPVSPKGVLLLGFLTKITTKFFDLFKVSKMASLIMTFSKLPK